MIDTVVTDGDRPGATRTLRHRDGNVQVERLIDHDDDSRSNRYELVETELAIESHQAELGVTDTGDHTCVVVWSADFHPAHDDGTAADTTLRFMRSGLDALRT